MNIRTGRISKLPKVLDAHLGLYENGVNDGRVNAQLRNPNGVELLVFFPSSQRAQVTALACTLPKDSGKALSHWTSSELVQAAKEKRIVKTISPSTIKLWLRQEKIKPWKYQTWQKSTDPRFLEKAIPILDLYEQAQKLAKAGQIVVCTDEKTSIQARKLLGETQPASPGYAAKVGDRYKRCGAVQLFAGLLVSTGETIARCFPRKRFLEFQDFLQTIFQSLWCKKIRCLHLILDNGSTHAPKKIELWIQTLQLPFQVQIHWLPVHASWLDQIEIVFSQLQRKVLKHNHSENVQELEKLLMKHFRERNKKPKPIQWSYTSKQLCKKFCYESLKRVAA